MTNGVVDKRTLIAVKKAALKAFESGLTIADALHLVRETYEEASKQEESSDSPTHQS